MAKPVCSVAPKFLAPPQSYGRPTSTSYYRYGGVVMGRGGLKAVSGSPSAPCTATRNTPNDVATRQLRKLPTECGSLRDPSWHLRPSLTTCHFRCVVCRAMDRPCKTFLPPPKGQDDMLTIRKMKRNEKEVSKKTPASLCPSRTILARLVLTIIGEHDATRS